MSTPFNLPVSLAQFEQFETYCQHFTNAVCWKPWVQAVCRKHHLLPCDSIRSGTPGTFPTFLVEERWVVKFYGRLFHGGQSFTVEQEASRLVPPDAGIPVATAFSSGTLASTVDSPLETDWPWPYLIFPFIPGISFREAAGQLSFEDRRAAAQELGRTVRQFHAAPLTQAAVFPKSRTPYLQFLAQQRSGVVERQRAWGCLPETLIRQIDDFLLPVEALIDPNQPPHLIHADLTADHLLGQFENGHWESRAIIDFGDAMTGDLFYELAPLTLDLFDSDHRCLLAFLSAYGLTGSSAQDRFAQKALSTALLHQFNVFEHLPEALRRLETLDQLAEALFRPA
jgi:hygromycin-B 7''-O-kinase